MQISWENNWRLPNLYTKINITVILAKIYETNFSVGVKQRTMGKFNFNF